MTTTFLRFLRVPGRPTGLLAGALLAALAAAPAHAQTFYALNRSGELLFTNTVAVASAGTTPTGQVITGVASGQTLVGLDSRPATGQLFALAYDALGGQGQLYTLDKASAIATAVGAAIPLALGGSTEGIGMDFNPVADRVRVTSRTGANLRLNPVTGGLAGTDTNLNFGAGAGTGSPTVGSVAYNNSFIAATTTIMYDMDEDRATLYIQNTPNSGTLTTPVALTIGGSPLLVPGDQTDFDIFTDPASREQSVLLARTQGGLTNLYSLNLTTGEAQQLAVNAGAGSSLDDLAFDIDRTAPTPAASARLLYAVTAANNLVSFNSDRPGFLLTAVSITGITTGQVLAATDFRPNTGELFGLGYDPALATANARLYTINLSTAVATPVGTGPMSLSLGTSIDGIAADFNPTVDRLRVTSIGGANLRLNPNTGTLVLADTNLNFVDGTTGTPSIGAVAYSNSYVGSTGTVMYDVDGVRNRLYVQGLTNSPNLGQLTAVSANPVFANSFLSSFDLDIAFTATTQTNTAFAVANAGATAPDGFSTLYTVNLTTAQTTAVGAVGLGVPVRDVAAVLTSANAAATVTGRLLYAVAAGNLVTFDSNNPGVIRSAVNIVGLAAGQVLAGTDFRPLTGDLYALGYNATAQQGQLYTLSLTTGTLTAVGGLNALPMGTTANALGLDFNPVADAIRIVSATNQANAAINPNTGAVTLNTPVTNPNGLPAISGVAYSNNDNNPATGTVLYGYDQVRNRVMSTTTPGAGTYTDLPNVAGVTLGATGVEFDIFSDLTNPAVPVNQGFIIANRSGFTTDNFYNVNLTNGSVLLIGRIGSGGNLSGAAAFLAPALTGIIWTGTVSTDWGTAGNWSTGAVPGPADNVTIPNTANRPVVSNAQQANTVLLGSGTTLTTAPGGTLTVRGNLVVNTGATLLGSGTGTVAFAGATAQTVSGTTAAFNNLSVGPAGLTAAGPVQVQRVLQLTGDLVSNGNLTLLSNATGTAQVENAGGLVTGNATVQRFIDPTANPGLGYRHYSSPVSGNTLADLATATFTPVFNTSFNTAANPGAVRPFPTVIGYDQSRVATALGSYTPFEKGFYSASTGPANTPDAMALGRGYSVNLAGTETVDFTGTLHTGTLAVPLARVAAGQPNAADAGWHLVGNPYPAPLDWSLTTPTDRTGLDAAMYVFESSSQYGGSFRTFLPGAPGGNSPLIGTAQGFWVRVSAGNTAGTLTFRDAQRLADFTTQVPVRRNAADPRPLVQLALAGAGAADDVLVYADANATAGMDGQRDAAKLPNPSGLNLAALAATGQALAIDGRPAFTASTVIPLRLEVPSAGTYTLAATLANLPAGLMAYLRDAATGQQTNLRAQPGIALTLAAGLSTRYSLAFAPAGALATASGLTAAQVVLYPNPATKAASVSVVLPVAAGVAATAEVLNTLGQVVRPAQVLAVAAGQATGTLPTAGLATGVYTVRLRTGAGTVSKRLVVE